MSELTEFLLARIAEDEAAAREYQAYLNARAEEMAHFRAQGASAGVVIFTFDAEGGPGDPARVLRECEAKRALVKHLTRLAAGGPVDKYNAADEALWCTLRVLAAVYVDHPEFRDEWRP